MIIPVRCFSCGKEISSVWEKYVDLIKENKTENESLNELNMNRICCRRMFLGHVDIIGKILELDVMKEK
ncbi:hypothetical protein H311_03856 [Anncaliia algerae PRA109]|nr:hypothetical protein H311_03856 [Anncaliia algerae PRA109]